MVGDRIASTRARIPRLRLIVPAGVSVQGIEIDGEPVPSPRDGEILLDPGNHRVPRRSSRRAGLWTAISSDRGTDLHHRAASLHPMLRAPRAPQAPVLGWRCSWRKCCRGARCRLGCLRVRCSVAPGAIFRFEERGTLLLTPLPCAPRVVRCDPNRRIRRPQWDSRRWLVDGRREHRRRRCLVAHAEHDTPALRLARDQPRHRCACERSSDGRFQRFPARAADRAGLLVPTCSTTRIGARLARSTRPRRMRRRGCGCGCRRCGGRCGCEWGVARAPKPWYRRHIALRAPVVDHASACGIGLGPGIPSSAGACCGREPSDFRLQLERHLPSRACDPRIAGATETRVAHTGDTPDRFDTGSPRPISWGALSAIPPVARQTSARSSVDDDEGLVFESDSAFASELMESSSSSIVPCRSSMTVTSACSSRRATVRTSSSCPSSFHA